MHWPKGDVIQNGLGPPILISITEKAPTDMPTSQYNKGSFLMFPLHQYVRLTTEPKAGQPHI